MNQDKLNKRVEFLRQEKNKSQRKVSTLDEIQGVWIDEDNDASTSHLGELGLKIRSIVWIAKFYLYVDLSQTVRFTIHSRFRSSNNRRVHSRRDDERFQQNEWSSNI